MRTAVVGGHGKTGRAVCAALASRGAEGVPLGRADWDDLAQAMTGCSAVYVIAPNLHPAEPAYVERALDAMKAAGITRVVYHSVASPYAPAMPHHLGKAMAEDVVRRSGLAWTILQPGAYLQNLDLSGPVSVPYSVDVSFGFLDLADLGAAAAVVLLEEGHVGATYELASRVCSVADLAAEAGVSAVRSIDRPADGAGARSIDRTAGATGARTIDRSESWLAAMFAYYDAHGLPVGTLPLRALLGKPDREP